ncbi:bacteriorhodopsin [Pseudanabaenaceae cyanobacterium LEGE 13415]|nr:bacteriorhodopsin [Pseudanabaenaceae cyanobacterium LEGE 13415]
MNQLWFWIGFVGMVIGACIFGSRAIATRRREGMEFHLESFFICLTAATLYLTLATNLTVINFKGESIFLGRYIDWSITTPLLLIELGVLAGLRLKLLAGVVLADLYMILTGLVANLEAAPTSFLWWTISTGAFVAIFLSLLTEFTHSAARRSVRVNNLFKKMRNILLVLWTAYPIIWLLGTEGFAWIPTPIETVLYTIVDLCAKVGFGFILTSADPETLADAADPSHIKETAESYMASASQMRSNRSY